MKAIIFCTVFAVLATLCIAQAVAPLPTSKYYLVLYNRIYSMTYYLLSNNELLTIIISNIASTCRITYLHIIWWPTLCKIRWSSLWFPRNWRLCVSLLLICWILHHCTSSSLRLWYWRFLQCWCCCFCWWYVHSSAIYLHKHHIHKRACRGCIFIKYYV